MLLAIALGTGEDPQGPRVVVLLGGDQDARGYLTTETTENVELRDRAGNVQSFPRSRVLKVVRLLDPATAPPGGWRGAVVLRDGRPVGCVGASGGPRIATATTQVLLNLAVHGLDPEAAVSAPRVHHQGTPDVLLVEPEVPDDVRTGLVARGYTVNLAPEPLAAAQAIWVRERDGRREMLAASDPRKAGLPAGE